jgi:phosphoglycolate phosphatase-like HAD superfamily hydrolase
VTEARLVILDLDGTLVRLDVDWARIRERVATTLAQRGLRPAHGIIATLAALDASGEFDAAQACRSIVTSAEVDAASCAMVNGALVDWLWTAAADAALAVLTRNDRAAALTAMTRIGLGTRLPPTSVIGRDDAPPKPSPDGVLRLMLRHGLSPPECVMVGDSTLDVMCGERAGIRTIHVEAIGVDWVDVLLHDGIGGSEAVRREGWRT